MYRTSDEFIKDCPEMPYDMAQMIAEKHDSREDFEEEFTASDFVDSDVFFTWLGY